MVTLWRYLTVPLQNPRDSRLSYTGVGEVTKNPGTVAAVGLRVYPTAGSFLVFID
jgi:hypothetical protein